MVNKGMIFSLPTGFLVVSFIEGFLMGIGVIGSTTVSGTVSTSSSLVSPVSVFMEAIFPFFSAQGYGIFV